MHRISANLCIASVRGIHGHCCTVFTIRWLCAAVVDGLKYQDSHEWAKVDGDIATVGISDFAQVLAASPHMHALCDRSAPQPGILMDQSL